MFIFEAVREEWDKCTPLGRATWVPMLAILLLITIAVFVPAIPLLYLLMLFYGQIARCGTKLRGLFFKDQ
jgi:hypothetical protein